jgi:hypothetical protein
MNKADLIAMLEELRQANLGLFKLNRDPVLILSHVNGLISKIEHLQNQVRQTALVES